MEPKVLLQIVSGFKPDIDGMGDFSEILGNGLWRGHGIKSHFAVYRRPATLSDPETTLPHAVSYPEEPTPKSFLNHVETLKRDHSFAAMLLHYGPYAYSKDGWPAAFAKVIEALACDTPLYVFFHETYSKGAPWRRTFWTYPEQRKVVKRLLAGSKASFTSTWPVMERLESLNTTHVALKKIRIFSNVGEPADVKPLVQRARQLVIFGRLVNRLRLYREFPHDLENICNSLEITTVVDVGAGNDPHIPAMIAGARVTQLGHLDEVAISKLLADSLAGVVGYGPHFWEKSGVLAAYLAHGMVPVLASWNTNQLPLPGYVPYLLASDIYAGHFGERGDFSIEKAQDFADAAHNSYLESQSVSVCVSALAAFLS